MFGQHIIQQSAILLCTIWYQVVSSSCVSFPLASARPPVERGARGYRWCAGGRGREGSSRPLPPRPAPPHPSPPESEHASLGPVRVRDPLFGDEAYTVHSYCGQRENVAGDLRHQASITFPSQLWINLSCTCSMPYVCKSRLRYIQFELNYNCRNSHLKSIAIF